MATYAVGDIQGCYVELQLLLAKMSFDPSHDQLWFVGDLVNRGPESLETLRFIKQLGDSAKIVLGNHDLHLLAVYYTQSRPKKSDTFNQILAAKDCDELMYWLKSQPLIHFDQSLNAVMVHAGIPVSWNIAQAVDLSREVEDKLQSEDYLEYFNTMYGNTPDIWSDTHTGLGRLRCITNHLTRMRFCSQNQQLELEYKGEIGNQAKQLHPWFDFYPDNGNNPSDAPLILFGHWAALRGVTSRNNIIALDTGCVWGEKMTAIDIENQTRYSVSSQTTCIQI